MKALQHLRTINHHKKLVMENCFKVGLYKQGLLHDLSKYTPSEFLVGCKYYQGTRSPNNAERGCTTKGATSTTMSIGSTTAATGKKESLDRRCRRDMW